MTPDWRPLGRHRYAIDGDAVFLEVDGGVSAPEILQFMDMLLAMKEEHRQLYCVCDARRAAPPSAEVRQAISDRFRAGRAPGIPTVMITNSAIIRTVMTLVFHAIRLLGLMPPSMDFVATPEEAAAWLARSRLQGMAAPRNGPAPPL